MFPESNYKALVDHCLLYATLLSLGAGGWEWGGGGGGEGGVTLAGL